MTDRYDVSVNTVFGVDLSAEYRECIHCNQVKHITEFPLRASIAPKYQGIDNRCKTCHAKVSKVSKALRRKHQHEFAGVCWCCNKELTFDKACCDHDHETDAFRGWLCENCNTGIGRLGDDIPGLYNAINYLERANLRQENERLIQRHNPLYSTDQEECLG